jgi:hypothetical protein
MRKLLVAFLLTGCGSHAETGMSGQPDAAALSTDADACEPPDVLILLDRTVSMAERPDGTKPPNTPAGHAESKWATALSAVETLTEKLDTTIQFGLALFPQEANGCITLAQRLSGMTASNPNCEAGEVLVEPTVQTGTAINAMLDAEATKLCRSTPIGAGLATARTQLATTHQGTRKQYVVFVSDGADTCNSQLALANTDALAADGVNTYVVAFDNGAPAGIDKGLLNDMACAGRTVTTGCQPDVNGNYRAIDRSGVPLFMMANDGPGLVTVFEQVAGAVCCGCIL